ncbi:MAG: hypothetical protein ACLRLW_04710 [Terrisporobacter sp.]|uniref:hypothetical protein n=1 Tax=Terrisporobacter sp. TaxID=1965305 RepID=UPI0039A3968A
MKKIIEKTLKWEDIRTNEKVSYNLFKKEFMNYMVRNNLIKGYDSKYYTYASDMLNLIATGRTAKELRKELDILDKSIRDNLEATYNERLTFVQDVFISYFRLNVPSNKILIYIVNITQDKFDINYSMELNKKMSKYNYLFR